ncbi:glycosyltransferase [Pseudoxanthomonas sp. PXM02]|jgi:colanic acid/amylovoran biosynthesis glycosyltransferase|uniref:glycosyltransferase n=1 Tax=Pseudoxanthomonas sp. PXM02 TaxID=2769294 RepID=UPI00177C6E0A|nr:glycosyltransferase [Pseudoxanthomonas sp. PXM02]MBD9479909.1 glycosyltransferase [Pseudoxanthomonas sp. PXM02]
MTATPPLQRAVYVVSLFPCWSETFIVREITALIENGVDVRIISLKKPSETLVQADAQALMDRVRHPGSPLHALWGAAKAFVRNPAAVLSTLATVVAGTWRSPSVLAKSLAAWLRGLEHIDWLRDFDPQVLHAHWATYPSTAAWTLSRVLRLPFGFTCHAHDIFIERQLIARKIQDAAVAVTISRFNVDWLSQRETAQAREKLQVIHCGVDLRANPWQPDGRAPQQILTVGRLDPIKGFATLVEALALLAQRGVDFQCRLLGSGPLDASLRSLAQARGVADRIEFCGAQPQDVVRRWMGEASLFVLPSEVAPDGNRDGIPVALMEAMATGCPVVSTRVSGIPELVEHETSGLLVDEKQPVALADAMQRLLEDAALRRQVVGGAREKVEREFDARKEARRLQDLMEGIAHAT